MRPNFMPRLFPCCSNAPIAFQPNFTEFHQKISNFSKFDRITTKRILGVRLNFVGLVWPGGTDSAASVESSRASELTSDCTVLVLYKNGKVFKKEQSVVLFGVIN
jgi:hypothetical protein